MKSIRPNVAYQIQKDNCKRRKIEFLFTFEEWVKWWKNHLGPDWFKLRGCRSGQYVMARKNDRGSYSPSNVVCITANQNHSDMAKNGTSTRGIKNPRAKLTHNQVIDLYFSVDVSKAAKKAGVETALVYMIKRKQIWQHITAGLSPAPYKQTGRGARTDLRVPSQ